MELPKYKARDDVEIKILADAGKVIDLQFAYKDSMQLRVPRWNIPRMHACTGAIAEIISAIYPNDLLFLLQIDFTQRATSISKLHKIIFYDIYDPALTVILATLGLSEKVECQEFVDSICQVDFLEIFCTIVEQEINNETVEAIIKKFQRLLAERFHLQNASFGLADLLAAAPSQLPEIIQ